MLVRRLPGTANAVAVAELSRAAEANYWRVVTSGVRSDRQIGKTLYVRARTPDTTAGPKSPLDPRAGAAGGTADVARGAERDGDIGAAPRVSNDTTARQAAEAARAAPVRPDALPPQATAAPRPDLEGARAAGLLDAADEAELVQP